MILDQCSIEQVSLAAETVEKVAEAVEKVADDVDRAAEEFASKLPEGGKLRGIVESIEHIAEETEKDAQLVQDLMDKVNFVFFPSILILTYLAILTKIRIFLKKNNLRLKILI